MEQLLSTLISFATSLAFKLLGAAFVLIIGRMIVKWVMRGIRNGKLMKKADPTVARFLTNAIAVLFNVILVVSVIGILGVPLTSVITVLASAGVAIGLALQGSLSNLAGGIMILIFKPFHLGDYIEVSSYGGTVKDIGIFYTVLNTPDNRVVTVPNGSIMAAEIVNYSVNDTRRVDLVFSVAYGTDVSSVIALLLDEAKKQELVLSDPAPFCRLSEHADHSLDFTLRVWVKKADFWTVKFNLLEAVNNRFEQDGVHVPYNQLDVHVIREEE